MLTGFGYVFIGIVAVTIPLTIRFSRRWIPHEKPGCFSFGMIGMVLFFLYLWTTMMGYSIGAKMYGWMSKPRYDAQIVAYSSEWSRNSDDREVEMFTAQVRFTDKQGRVVTLPVDVSSGDVPETGKQLQVVYETGDHYASELTMTSVLLNAVGAVIVLLTGALSIASIQYAFNGNAHRTLRFAGLILFRIIFPGLLLTLLGGLLFGAGAYFMGTKPGMPLWAAIICCFFSVVLLFATIPVLKIMYRIGGGGVNRSWIFKKQ